MNPDGEASRPSQDAEDNLKRVQEHLGEEDKQLDALGKQIHEAERKSKKVIRDPEEG
jgi:hypothetical protein